MELLPYSSWLMPVLVQPSMSHSRWSHAPLLVSGAVYGVSLTGGQLHGRSHRDRSTLGSSHAMSADFPSEYLVWCPGQYRWRLHEGHVAVNMARRRQHPSVLHMREEGCTAIRLMASPAANSMPASSGTNTRDFMCFFLFWLVSLPAIWFPIHKM
jgi:hypothetical protein